MQKIAIVGSGVVGRATGLGFLEKGHEVIFFDKSETVVNNLKSQGLRAFSAGRLGEARGINIFFVSVPTPNSGGKIDLQCMEEAASCLGNYFRRNKSYSAIVLRSTIVPGTTREFFVPIVEEISRKKAGADFGVCFNPEYLREVSNVQDFHNPWLVTIGEWDARSGDCLELAYGQMECPVVRLSIEAAEMQKYVHNLFNACKISFFNEMRLVCNAFGIDADEVFKLTVKSAEGMWNPAYGTKNKGPFDGKCLPKDTQAFKAWAAEQFGMKLPLLKAVIDVNNNPGLLARAEDCEFVGQELPEMARKVS